MSSLSEIIYCSEDVKIGTEDEMNGILIYTTTTDAEGSLGGLVEKGNPEYLSSIIHTERYFSLSENDLKLSRLTTGQVVPRSTMSLFTMLM